MNILYFIGLAATLIVLIILGCSAYKKDGKLGISVGEFLMILSDKQRVTEKIAIDITSSDLEAQVGEDDASQLRDDLEEYREDHPKPWYLRTKTNYDRSTKGGVTEY